MKISSKQVPILFSVISCGLLMVMTYFWLKLPNDLAEPSQVATDFLNLLKRGEFDRAHEMTLKNSYVGTTPKELKAVSARQLCTIVRIARTFPFQTNGNRLRRWVLGLDVEMSEVYIDFEGQCLLGVSLHRNSHGQWKVFNFESHAG